MRNFSPQNFCMKQMILFSLAWLPLLVWAQNDPAGQAFTIKGDLKNLKKAAACIYIHYIANNTRVTDSAKVEKNKYVLSGSLNEPTIVQLQVRYKDSALTEDPSGVAAIFLDPGTTMVTSTGAFSKVTVKGSASHKLYAEFEKKIQPFGDSMQQYYKRYLEARQQNDYNVVRDIEGKAIQLEKTIKDSVMEPFIIGNPQSPVALMALQQYVGNREIDIAKIEPLFNNLAAAVKQYPSALQLKERIDVVGRTAIGRQAADFIQNDTLGNPVSLSSLKGKYLLVDFWASWCGPCRQENPNVVEAFQKYKTKGFFVLGVSLDKPGAKDAWMKAIYDDNLTWTHVSDLQFWNNAAAKLYGIQSIPQNLLLDPSGKIIAKNLRGPELHAKLEEIFR